MFPVVYTPTEADAISEYSHLFRRSEGLYLSPPGIDMMEEDFLDACEGRQLDLAGHFMLAFHQLIDRLLDSGLGCGGNLGDRRSGEGEE